MRNTEPLGKLTVVYRWAVNRRPFLRHSICGVGLPIAEQINVATRPEMTY